MAWSPPTSHLVFGHCTQLSSPFQQLVYTLRVQQSELNYMQKKPTCTAVHGAVRYLACKPTTRERVNKASASHVSPQ